MNLKLSLIKISTNFIKINTNFMFPDVIYQTSCKRCSEDCVKTITGIKLRTDNYSPLLQRLSRP